MANKEIAIGQAVLDLRYSKFSKEAIAEEIGSRWSEIKKDRKEEIIRKSTRGVDSLINAIEKAGGDPTFIKEQRYFMSASEFIAYLSLNDILFTYTPKEENIIRTINISDENKEVLVDASKEVNKIKKEYEKQPKDWDSKLVENDIFGNKKEITGTVKSINDKEIEDEIA